MYHICTTDSQLDFGLIQQKHFLTSLSIFSGKQLATIDKKIDPGLTIIGDLNIFGLLLSCRININPSVPHFLFHVQMKAIKLKRISFTKIDGKDDEGPEFRVEIGKSNFDVKINAKVTVLGVSAGAAITVTKKEYSFKIEGRMFDVFKAELHCRAAYGDLKNAEFSVSYDSFMIPMAVSNC